VTRRRARNPRNFRAARLADALLYGAGMTKHLILAMALLGACGSKKSESIGVAECDAYETKMAACAQKVGGKVGDQLESMRKMMIEPWQKNAADDNSKGDLPKVCTNAIADMKKQLPQCDW
jgi:hypothetical protein